MIKIVHLQAAFLLTLSTSALGTSIEPEKIYEQNVAHYQTGYYSELGADFSSEADGQEDSANVASQEIDEEIAPISDSPESRISENEYELSELERMGLEKLFAQEARKYRSCVKRKEADCYSDEIYYLQKLLSIYDAGMDASRPRFNKRSTSREREFTRKGRGVLYQWTVEFSEEAGLVVSDFCLEGKLKESHNNWTPSIENCARLKGYGEHVRKWYRASLLSEEYRDIPLKLTTSKLQSTDYFRHLSDFSPCKVIGRSRCTKANRLAKNQDWHELKLFAEKLEAESYLWKFYKSLANIQLGDTETAVEDLNELLSTFPTSTYFYASDDWKQFSKSAASILVSYYYATEDYQSAVECCSVLGVMTSDLGVEDHLIFSGHLMRASAMTLIKSPNTVTALIMLGALNTRLDELNSPELADIRIGLDQQRGHLRQQLEAIGRGATL